ncbi:hypothetical protein FOZ62_010326, partial [Perkinsus olseni]
MSSLAQRVSSTVAKRVAASPEPAPLAIYCYKKHFMRQQQIKEKIKGLQNPQKADCGPLGEYKCDSLNVPSAPVTAIPNRVAATASGSVRNLSTSAPRFYTQEEINTAQNFFQLMMD